MKRKNVIIVFILFLTVFLMCNGGEGYAQADENKEIADRIRSIFNQESQTFDSAVYPMVTSEREQTSVRDATRLQDYIASYPNSVLSGSFGGLYLNEEKDLVVLLTDKPDRFSIDIMQVGFEKTPVYAQVEYSYYETKDALNSINASISEMYSSVMNGKGSQEENMLMSFYPCPEYQDQNNTILLRLVAETDTDFDQARSLFTKLIGDYPMVSFVAALREEVVKNTYTTVRPGIGIVIPISSTLGNYYSLGYKTQYTEGSTVYNGMVTSAHGTVKGEKVYLCPFGNTLGAELGEVYERYLSGSVDASFIKFKSNMVPDVYVYYTNSTGSTTQTVYLNSFVYSPVSGETIYKSGRSSYLSSGVVSSTSTSSYLTGAGYLTDMFAVPECIGFFGDSGAITYRLATAYSGRSLGLCEGGDNDITFFIKATNITAYLVATPY